MSKQWEIVKRGTVKYILPSTPAKVFVNFKIVYNNQTVEEYGQTTQKDGLQFSKNQQTSFQNCKWNAVMKYLGKDIDYNELKQAEMSAVAIDYGFKYFKTDYYYAYKRRTIKGTMEPEKKGGKPTRIYKTVKVTDEKGEPIKKKHIRATYKIRKIKYKDSKKVKYYRVYRKIPGKKTKIAYSGKKQKSIIKDYIEK